MAILGNNVFVCVGSGSAAAIIAGTRSNEINTSSETIEISSPTSGQWREYLAGRKEWSITTGFLVLTSSDIQGLLNIGNTYHLQIVERQGSAVTIVAEGDAIMVTCRVSGSVGNLLQGSFQFQGNGELAAPN